MERLTWLAIFMSIVFVLVQVAGTVYLYGDPTPSYFAFILLLVAFEMRSRLKHER